MSYLESALQSLRPDVAWVLPGEPILANVLWPDGITPPTQAEVDAEVARLTTERTQSRQQAALTMAIQAYIDAPARAWGYDDAKSAVGYVGDDYPRFNAEGLVIRAFRSECWQVADQVRAEVMNGEREMPTMIELLALLPEAPYRPAA